ncbi:ATP-binding protein [Candidatus Woesearchaeota archaeon]|nr:ATP-binding protein [Candidatus Woesearchaeota archaeon]
MISKQLENIFLKEKDPFTDILGQDKIKLGLKSALLVGRHVIIVGAPGIGKTTLAKNIAELLPEVDVVDGCEFHCDPKNPVCPSCKASKQLKTKKVKGVERFIRIQGSPDLTVEDLLGDIDPVKALKFGPLSIEAFTPGKIFKANNGILFFDEVNRCPEKLQNALLQVLQEGKATISSYDVDIPANFILIATMNPEDTSTERISDVFIDRFDVLYMTYPETTEIETEIVKQKGKSIIDFPDKLLGLAVYFVRLIREDKNLSRKPSVRASIGLYERAQANAKLKGKTKVDFEDITESVISVLSHRIELKPSAKYLQSPSEYIAEKFKDFSNSDAAKKSGCL